MDPIFTHRLEVRFRDCDPLGHASVEAGAPGVILAHADIDYRQPARYGDALEVRIGLVNIGRTSFTYEYEILSSAGGLVASARTVLVMYDYAASRPVPVPDELRAILPVPVASEP